MKVRIKDKNVLVSFSCYDFRDLIRTPIISFSFFQLLLPEICGEDECERIVLVSFSCYLIDLLFILLRDQVLVSFSCYKKWLRMLRRGGCFSFFQLLQHEPRRLLQSTNLVLVSFSCYVEINRYSHARSFVLVSFSCYSDFLALPGVVEF